MKLLMALAFGAASVAASVPSARACGGGLVSMTGSVGQNAQRIFISVRGGTTDVVTQVGVPATSADYGVLVPVAAEPTLDPTPVPSDELDALDRWTAPQIARAAPHDDSIGCGCGGVDSAKGGVGGEDDVHVSQPVAIGPVTAVVITGTSADAINAWLSSNGFAIPPADQAIVAAYAGAGRYFIALRRNDTAATGGATSVGIHFTMAGDQRALPLGFARLGAGPTVSFTIWVAADTTVAPSLPFEGLTLADLDAATLRGEGGYQAAVTAAVAAHANQAFVLEGTWPTGSLRSVGASLQALLGEGQTVTRLSTILPATALSGDVAFDTPFTGSVPNYRLVQADLPAGPRMAGFGLGGATLALGLALSRRRRR